VGFEAALITEYPEPPFAGLGGDGGGGEFGAVTVSFAVDDLLFGGAVGSLDDAAGLWFADESETEPVLITQRARPT
jgi:hypothetical protein